MAVSNSFREIAKEMRTRNNPTESLAENQTSQPSENADIKDKDIWMQHDKLVSKTILTQDEPCGLPVELRQYIKQPLIPRSNDPLEFWEALKLAFPNCYDVVIRYLSVVATSVPSESLFSLASNIDTDNRSRLNPERLAELTFMSSLTEERWGFYH